MPDHKLLCENPVLAEADGRTFDGYLSRPAEGVGPGLIIVTEMWGTTKLNRDMADSYARRGWCALVPSMFWRSERTGTLAAEGPGIDAAWERLRAYDFDRGAQDVRIAAEWLRGSPACSGKVATIGFCMGGRTAVLACARSELNAGGLCARHPTPPRRGCAHRMSGAAALWPGRRSHPESRDRSGDRRDERQPERRDLSLSRCRPRLLQSAAAGLQRRCCCARKGTYRRPARYT